VGVEVDPHARRLVARTQWGMRAPEPGRDLGSRVLTGDSEELGPD
jgi:hypothetical protein